MANQKKGGNHAPADTEEESGFVISLSTFGRKLKKYCLPWILTSIIAGGAVVGYFTLFKSAGTSTPVQAMVNFTYDGIEKGQNPDGTDFEASSLKSPAVIEAALQECGMSVDSVESIRANITIYPIIPEDAYQRLTAYKNIYENKQTIDAAQKMLDESWFATKYTIKLNYASANMSQDDAVVFLNTMLECYRDEFLEKFGYSNTFGNALSAVDYTNYDYAEAVDRINHTLTDWKTYINDLALQDTTRYRSTVTGYTFADLVSAIDTVQSIDVDLLNSYIASNNITKDQARLLAYYEYRVEEVTREKTSAEEMVNSLQISIDNYVKDNTMVIGQNGQGTNLQSTTASKKYDDLITQKTTYQDTVASATQEINYYNLRIASLRRPVSTDKKAIEEVETEFKRLQETVNNLSKIVTDTAEDYYSNAALENAYNIVAPARSSTQSVIHSILNVSLRPVFGLEVLILVFFLALAFIQGIREDNRKKQPKTENSNANHDTVQETEPAEESGAAEKDHQETKREQGKK